jgi:hypothetical protein
MTFHDFPAAHALTTSKARLGRLFEMLTYKRPHGSLSEHRFIERFLAPLGVECDGFGNLWKAVGPLPNMLWSSHVDSCHRTSGLQPLQVDGLTVSVADPENANCLGADCAAGVWLMTEMIAAGIPGLYVFHRGEERGGLGSAYVARTEPERLDGIAAAIAFDRRGTHSIITHQRGSRACSDAFADALAAALGLDHRRDDSGTFTDTANYVDLVGECTNVSVGYDHEHTVQETLDIGYLLRLRAALLNIDAATLPIVRKPGEADPTLATYCDDWQMQIRPRSRALYDIVYDQPAAVADFLEHCGVTSEDLEDYIGDSIPF